MGKVYLVGAGPGDPGLLTVKAKELLIHADVVVYDALISQPILDLIPTTAEQINVGKRRGSHTLAQETTTQLLITKAQAAAIVIRLKGGDPFIFGRGGEEMSALVEAGIEVEVIPGISSGIAAPAYAGIPITHREYSSSVLFVTGHETVGKYRPQVNWQAIAKAAETIIIYMGIHNLSTIVADLIVGGKPLTTPVAIIRWGTTPKQTVFKSTLQDLQIYFNQPLQSNPYLQAPAIVVVGPVVRLADQLPILQSRI